MRFDRKRSKIYPISLPALSCIALLTLLLLPTTLLAKDFTFSWSANPEPVEGYRLYYKMGGEAGPPFDGTTAAEGDSPVTAGKVTTFTITGLEEGVTYHFALTAYNGAEESDFSPTISIYAEPDPPPAGDDTASYSFVWSANPEPVEGYRFHYKKGGEAAPPFDGSDASEGGSAIDIGKQTSFTISGLDKNSTYHFATTAYHGSDESAFSEIISVYAEESHLQAIIVPSAVSGEAPFWVNFDASFSSGAISSYAWVFGDGDIAIGPTVSNRFDTAGEYTTTLTITGQDGEVAQAEVTISVSGATSPPPSEGPTAVISTSAATGDAPLVVEFDGRGSTAGQTPIVLYSWAFGDGGTITGATPSHLYTNPGTYQASLTVTDGAGNSSQTSTPVLITGVSSGDNQPPIAFFTASPSLGVPPLTVTFNGAGSHDPDGSITSYHWSFGNGSTASGPRTAHIYTVLGEYQVTLSVTDNLGQSSSTTRTISLVSDEEYKGIIALRSALTNIIQILLIGEEESPP